MTGNPGNQDARKIEALDKQLDKRFLVIEVNDGSGAIDVDLSDGFSGIELLGIAEWLKDYVFTDDEDEEDD